MVVIKMTVTFLTTATLKYMIGGKLMTNFTLPQLSSYNESDGSDENDGKFFDDYNFESHDWGKTDV
jgi:hypothetical protein